MSAYSSGPSVLQRTSTSAKNLTEKLSYVVSTKAAPPCPPVVINLKLPVPKPLTSRLKLLGVDEVPAQKISDTFLALALRLKEEMEVGVRRMLNSQARYFQHAKYATVLPATYSAIYAQFVEKWVSYLFKDVLPRVMRARAAQTKDTSRGISTHPIKRPFNQAAIPILEQFFDVNAFPSRLEKYELATECNMDYRQIHVWFQNHRTRCRREGKELKQPSRPATFMKDIESSVVEMLLPRQCDEDGPDDQCPKEHYVPHKHTPALPPSAFNLNAPPHAFPSPYPPLCSYDPFPPEHTARSFPTPWLRHPASAPLQHAQTDVVDLEASFRRMSISGTVDDLTAPPPVRRLPRRPLQPTLGFVTPCARAPHPALVRRNRGLRPTCGAWCNRSRTRPKVVKPPKHARVTPPTDYLQTSTISSSPIVPCIHRQKKAGLPQRFPSTSPYPQRSVSPRSLSGSTASRTPSACSLPSSSDGLTSDNESPISTPPLLPSTLAASPSNPPCHPSHIPRCDLYPASPPSHAHHLCTLDVNCDPSLLHLRYHTDVPAAHSSAPA